MPLKTKGAFGKARIPPAYSIENDVEFIVVLRRISCYRCNRTSKFTKKNFPIPVVINKEKIGYLCKVCVKKAWKLKNKMRI